MKIRRIVFVNILTLLFSCKRSDYQQKILGDWKLVGLVVVEKGVTTLHNLYPGYNPRSGYFFFDDDSCDNKIGFIHGSTKKNGKYNSKTNYRLDDDSLMIYNNVDSTWEGLKIKSIVGDTLLVKMPENGLHYDMFYKYVKQHYVANPAIDFDEVVLTNYSTWGLGDNILVNSGGDISYQYHENYYTSKISRSQFQTILDRFQKSDLYNLKSEYRDGGADGPEISLSFIKDKKVVKTIRADEGAGPLEFVWAYIPLEFLNTQLKLDTVRDSKLILNARFFGFEGKQQQASMPPSMFFFLSTLLREAKETTALFTKKYDIPFDGSVDLSRIQTNGQLYQITYKNGTKKTYDIGFNFIERNAGFIKFSDKKKHE